MTHIYHKQRKTIQQGLQEKAERVIQKRFEYLLWSVGEKYIYCHLSTVTCHLSPGELDGTSRKNYGHRNLQTELAQGYFLIKIGKLLQLARLIDNTITVLLGVSVPAMLLKIYALTIRGSASENVSRPSVIENTL